MKKRTVLVTGGAGYIGSHTVLALQDRGWSVAVLDDLSSGHRSAVADGAAFYVGDISDSRLVLDILDRHKISAVVHFAGSLSVPESIEAPLKYYSNNTSKSRDLLAATLEGGVGTFIFSSTAATYGIPADSLVSERSIQQPINPYGWSKLMTERMLIDTAAVNPLTYGILRYFNVAGADPNGRIGQSTVGATHLIKVAVEAALGKRGHVKIFGADFPTVDGTGIRDYIHVSDLATAHVLALEHLIVSPGSPLILNCGYGHGYSVNEVLDTVDQVAGTKLSRVIAPRRPGDPPSLISDSSLLRSKLPWKPLYADLELIVSHALEWERSLTDRLS